MGHNPGHLWAALISASFLCCHGAETQEGTRMLCFPDSCRGAPAHEDAGWFYLFISSSDGSEHEAPRHPSSLGTDACAKTSNGNATTSPKGTLLTTSY